jgi:hypothetical protein
MTAQTAHTPARINPDTRPVLVVVLLGILLLLLAAGALSFAALSAVAGWAGVHPELAWFVPVFIEGAIIVYTGVAIVHTARHELDLARRAWWWVRLWTAVSAAANGAHAFDAGPGGWQGMVGVILAALIPVAVYGAVHMATGLIVAAVEPAHPPVIRTVDTGQTHERRTADARTDTTPDSGQATNAGQTTPDTGQRTDTPDPLAVLEEIETSPRTDGQADDTDTRTDSQVYDQTADTAPDTQTDGQVSAPAMAGQADEHRTRPVRERRPSASGYGSVVAVRPQIEELARQGMKGREIAELLGTGKSRTCEIVRELKDSGVLSAA